MPTRLSRFVTTLLVIATLLGWTAAGILAVRTAAPGGVSNETVVTRVADYLEVRIRSEREGFTAAAVRDFLAGPALADAEAFAATTPPAVEGAAFVATPSLVLLVRGGTSALVQASGEISDAFGTESFAEQYLLRLVDDTWMIEAVYRLEVAPAS